MATEKEIQFIKENYLTMPQKAMARELGRSNGFMHYWIKKLNIEVPKEVAERFRKENTYQKGHEPWNKGIEWKNHPEGCKATQFKKGHKPHTTKEDGHVTVRVDGRGRPYKWIRIEEGHWDHYHRIIYEVFIGDIPDGYIVAFKDGDTMNCDPDNLELITREENMRRNTIHRYPDELKTTMRRIGKIKKQIKDAKKQNH